MIRARDVIFDKTRFFNSSENSIKILSIVNNFVYTLNIDEKGNFEAEYEYSEFKNERVNKEFFNFTVTTTTNLNSN
jgi:hypothetical protein